jgi:hypothetical protein
MSRRLFAAATAAAALMLVGCGSSEPAAEAETTAAEATPSTEEAVESPEAPEPDAPPAAVVPETVDPSESEPSDDAQIVAGPVQIFPYEFGDRIEIAFEGTGTPGWFASYVDALVYDGSGEEFDPAQPVLFELRLTGLAQPESDPGDVAFEPDLSVIQAFERLTIFFEGQNQYGIGLSEQVPYRIWIEPDPDRVILEFVTVDS